jgi:hypothetical protein
LHKQKTRDTIPSKSLSSDENFPLTSLGGRENKEIDHLDKTKDLNWAIDQLPSHLSKGRSEQSRKKIDAPGRVRALGPHITTW